MFWNIKELSQDVEELLKYCEASVIFIAFNSLHPAFLSSADIFSKSILLKNSFKNTTRVSNSLVPFNILSGLILVQPVCKGYQQMTLGIKN